MAMINQTDSRILNARNRDIETIKLQLRSNEHIWVIDDESLSSEDIFINGSTPITIFLVSSNVTKVLSDVGIYIKPYSNSAANRKTFASILEWGYGGFGLQVRQPITTNSSWVSITGNYGSDASNRVSILLNKGEILPNSITPVELRLLFPPSAQAINSLQFELKSIFEEHDYAN